VDAIRLDTLRRGPRDKNTHEKSRRFAKRLPESCRRGSLDKLIQGRDREYNVDGRGETESHPRDIVFAPPPTEYRKIRGFSVDFGNRGYLERQIDVRAKVDARDASASCQGSPSYEEEFCASHDGTKAFPRLAFIELRVSAEIMPHPNADRGGRYGASA